MKLTVLGGFLGSGKTTWLRHQLHHGSFPDAFVLVNEAADVAVDDLLLGESMMLAVLAGGCACCETLEELLRMLRSIADRRVAAAPAGPRFDRLILETSGLADPGRIVEAIRTDPVLVNHIVIGETIVVVDAVNGLDQMRSEPLCRRQIEVADRLVITKVDEADGTSIGRLIATLKMLNPGRSSPAPFAARRRRSRMRRRVGRTPPAQRSGKLLRRSALRKSVSMRRSTGPVSAYG